MSPSPLGPWHRAHCAANTVRPSATLPDPAGSPVPSGAIAEARSRNSSGVGGRPTPNRGDCASAVTVQSTSAAAVAAAARSRIAIGDGPVRGDPPELDAVVVIRGVETAHRDQRLARRLHVAALVHGA